MTVEGALDWRDRQVSATEAVSTIRRGDKVFIGSACATPHSLVEALEQLKRPGVTLVHFLTSRVAASDPPQTSYRHRVFYVGSDELSLRESGRNVEYLRLSLPDVPRLFQNGRIPLDVAMVQVAPPDPDDTCSLGISVDVTKAAALAARTVIEEDVETRFLQKLTSLTDSVAQYLCSVDYDQEMAFAAVVGPPEHERIVAASCYYLSPATGLAEVGLHGRPGLAGRGPRDDPTFGPGRVRPSARCSRLDGGRDDRQFANDARLRTRQALAHLKDIRWDRGADDAPLNRSMAVLAVERHLLFQLTSICARRPEPRKARIPGLSGVHHKGAKGAAMERFQQSDPRTTRRLLCLKRQSPGRISRRLHRATSSSAEFSEPLEMRSGGVAHSHHRCPSPANPGPMTRCRC